MANLEDITAPIAIKYGEQDEQSYAKSANYIYEHIKHNDKEISGYPHSKHLMTHGEGRPDVERDIIAFLEDYE
jgi:carboxylesterase